MLITYKTQYTFDDCRFPATGRLVYFDYAIFHNDKLICLLEYDGAQHYSGWDCNELSLKYIQEHDAYKTTYCKNKHIPLIRIPFYDFDKLSIKYFMTLFQQIEGNTDANDPEL